MKRDHWGNMPKSSKVPEVIPQEPYNSVSMCVRKDDNSLEKTIAVLYVLFMPVRLISQLSVLKNVFGVCADFMPFIFHALGLTLWIINEGGRLECPGKEDLAHRAVMLIIWLNISSVIMACIIQFIYGNHGSENAFQGIAGMIVYFTQYLLMLLYNYRVFRLLSIDELNKYLHIDCLVLLVIGYFQVLVMNGIGGTVYDRVNVFGVLNASSRLPKLCLTGSEGASAGGIIAVFVMPYLLSRVIMGQRRYIYEALLWLIPLYYTHSTTAFILFAVDVVVFAFLLILKSDKPSTSLVLLFLVVISAVAVFYALLWTGVLNKALIEEINYLLFDKATDLENGSTVSRTVPLYANWGAFTEYPILGVGNGLQGYFYEKYFPDWAFKAPGSDAGSFLIRSREGISNGGIFFPSLLSGYGIIGCVLILSFIRHCIQENSVDWDKKGNWYYLYILSGVAIIVAGFQGDFYGKYYMWLFLSVPFMTVRNETEAVTSSKAYNHASKSRYIR